MVKNISANPDDDNSEMFVFQSMLVREADEAGTAVVVMVTAVRWWRVAGVTAFLCRCARSQC